MDDAREHIEASSAWDEAETAAEPGGGVRTPQHGTQSLYLPISVPPTTQLKTTQEERK
jgi:hypothetical protein